MKRETGQLLICYKMLRTEHSRKFTTFSEQHFKYLTQQYFGLVAEQSHLLVDQCVDLTMSFVLKKSKVRNKISKLIHSKHSLRHPYSSGGKSILKESMKILKRSKQIFLFDQHLENKKSRRKKYSDEDKKENAKQYNHSGHCSI